MSGRVGWWIHRFDKERFRGSWRWMSRSGGGTVNAVLYVIVLASAVRAGAVLLGGDIARVLQRPPVAAVALWLIVAIPSLLQFAFPGLLHALERDPDQVRQHGQWWRLVTSAAVRTAASPAGFQPRDPGDSRRGGAPGLGFCARADHLCRRRRWLQPRHDVCLALRWRGELCGDVHPGRVGDRAGCGEGVRARRGGGGRLDRWLGTFLLALGDAHGSAVVGGLVVGVLAGAISPPGIISSSTARAARVDAR